MTSVRTGAPFLFVTAKLFVNTPRRAASNGTSEVKTV